MVNVVVDFATSPKPVYMQLGRAELAELQALASALAALGFEINVVVLGD